MLRDGAAVTLEVARGHEAVMTVDGHHEIEAGTGSMVRITRSPRQARFVRLGGANQFYANLAQRLGWLRLDHQIGELERD